MTMISSVQKLTRISTLYTNSVAPLRSLITKTQPPPYCGRRLGIKRSRCFVVHGCSNLKIERSFSSKENQGNETQIIEAEENDTINSKASRPNNEDMDTYAVAILSPNSNSSAKLSLQNLRIEQILKRAPATHARDFFSMSLTSLGDAASRKRRAMMSQYSTMNNKIHPWFILPRETEIIMSFGCVRAIISQHSALIFDAHKPTIKQQAIRIAEGVQKRDHFTLHDGQIIYRHESKQKRPHFEIRMVEEIIREVCTMYNRRIRLYEPIVNSLMDRVTNEVFSPSGLHKLVPVKDSLQHFEMNVKGAIHCITDLLSNDEDMLDLLLTEKSVAKSKNQELHIKAHENVELLLEEYGRQLNSILLEIAYLLQRVQSKQDMVALSLDAYRNRMIRMNLYLSMGGISLAFGTAVAGFFGMNVINGMEQTEGIFEAIVLGSTLTGGIFLGACASYVDGSRMQRRTLENLNQIEVLNRALSDMPALDYSFELMLKEDGALTKDMFREKIYASEPESIRDSEIDFLFDLLDYSKDNLIDKEDFRPIAEHSSR